MPLAAQVEQPTRGGYQDIATRAEGGDLRAFADAAVAGGDREAGVARIGVHVLGDLDDQFAGRGQDQATDHSAVGAGLGAQQLGDEREGESGGLTGTGLGDADDVGSLQDNRDGRRLNGCRHRVPLVGHGLQDGGIKAESIKRHCLKVSR